MILIVNMLVILSLGFFSADISNQFINEKLETAPGYPIRKDIRKRQVKESLVQHKQYVIQNNIFNSSPEPEDIETTNQPVIENTPEISGVIKADVIEDSLDEKKKNAKPTTLRVNLKGTIVGENDIYVAIIEDLKKRSQSLFHLNDTIQEGVKIADIERNKVYIIHDGKMELLEIYDKKKKKRASRSRNPRIDRNVPPPTPEALAETELSMVVDKSELDEALANIPQLLTKARIVPSFSNGKNEGFKIFSIAKGSIFEKVGLRNGDILVRINESEIKDPQKFLSIFQQLKDETSIDLDLVRKGTKQTISYDIR